MLLRLQSRKLGSRWPETSFQLSAIGQNQAGCLRAARFVLVRWHWRGQGSWRQRFRRGCRRRSAPSCTHGSRAPHPLAHELAGCVASLLRRPVRPQGGTNDSKVRELAERLPCDFWLRWRGCCQNLGSISSHPRKEREDGAPFSVVVEARTSSGLRRGSRAPHPLAHELAGCVASLLAGQFAHKAER